jgi:vacuolar-type H+-ATPase subunit H
VLGHGRWQATAADLAITLSDMDAAVEVGRIVEAAERAADEIREQAETRARERIAEADRATENRVRAAEEEANELLTTARAEAAKLTSEAQKLRQEAEEERVRLVAEALEAANEEASSIRTKAQDDARSLLSEARGAANQVLAEGSDLSGDLRDLSTSLRSNAEKLLRDIKAAHSAMTARLDAPRAADGRGSESDPRPRSGRMAAPGADVDVPEFIPGER